MKCCIKCKLLLSANLNNFPPAKRNSDGLNSYCRPCSREIGKKYDLTKRKRSTKEKNTKSCKTCNWHFENKCAVKTPGTTCEVESEDLCLKWESIKIEQDYDENSGSFGSIYSNGIDFSESIGGYKN